MITRLLPSCRPSVYMHVFNLRPPDPAAYIRMIELLTIHVEEVGIAFLFLQICDSVCVAEGRDGFEIF